MARTAKSEKMMLVGHNFQRLMRLRGISSVKELADVYNKTIGEPISETYIRQILNGFGSFAATAEKKWQKVFRCSISDFYAPPMDEGTIEIIQAISKYPELKDMYISMARTWGGKHEREQQQQLEANKKQPYPIAAHSHRKK